MKCSAKQRSKVRAFILVGGALVVGISGAATAQDIGLDFHFLEVGMKRKAVIARLGTPNAETQSQTLFVKYRRLTWLDPEGRRYSASFVSDLLFRWKTCSPGAGDC
jgi:hypothetical protein